MAWCVAGTLAASLGLTLALESVRPEWRDPEYGHKRHAPRLADAEVVALGSSRILNGLRPAWLPAGSPRVYNFGLTRHGPVLQRLALERLLRDGVRPKAVTLEIYPAALAVGARELDAVPPSRHTFGDMTALVGRGERPAGDFAAWLDARAVPWSAHRFALMSHWAPPWVMWDQRQDYLWTATDADGWLPAPPANDPAAIRQSTVAIEGEILRHFRIDPAADRALRASVARCRAEGIPVAAILMPETAWCRAFLSPADTRRLGDYARSLGVPVIDARDWCADDGFRDGGHLIGRGVDDFTRRIGPALATFYATTPSAVSAIK